VYDCPAWDHTLGAYVLLAIIAGGVCGVIGGLLLVLGHG
jgi:hypothetical protein